MRHATGLPTAATRLLLLGSMGLAVPALAADADSTAVMPGVEQRQLQQVDPERFRITPEPKIEVPALPPMRAVAETPVKVDRFEFTGNTAFGSPELAALVDRFRGDTTFRGVVEAAQVISEHYRQAGYLVARAYVPEQEITDGTVRIAVIEGAIGEIRIQGDQPVKYPVAARRMERLANSGVVNEPDLEYGALLINDLPGTGASVALVPGSEPGRSDVEVTLADKGTWDFAVDYNNFGTPVTGEHRFAALAAANNLFNVGDRFMLRPIISDTSDTLYGEFGYSMPLFTPATTVGLRFSQLQSTLGEEFTALEIDNTATSIGLQATHAFVRSRNRNIYGLFDYESRGLQRECGICANMIIPFVEDADYQLDVLQLGASGDSRDEWKGGGIYTWYGFLRFGLSDVTPQESGTTVNTADRIDGSFTSLRLGAQRLQRMGDIDTLSLKLDLQFSGEDLDASERIGLGGPDAVRAYRPSEALGDSGLVLQTEWRRQMPGFVAWADWFTGAEYYFLIDGGFSSLNDNGQNLSRETDNSRLGGGLGLRLSKADKFHFDLVAATRLDDEPSLVDQPDDSETNFWAQAIWWF